MPVLVVGEGRSARRAAVRALSRASPQVRVYVSDASEVDGLRAMGAKVATGSLEDGERLEAVMSGVHTVCYLSPTPERAGRVSTGLGAVAVAAARVKARRMLVLLPPGGDPEAAAALVPAEALEHVIVCPGPVYGPEAPWFRLVVAAASHRKPGLRLDTSRALRPVFVEDVASVLAAADDRERVVSGAWRLDGDRDVTLAALLDILAGLSPMAPRGGGWRPHRRWRRGKPPEEEVADLEAALAAPAPPPLPDAAREFGVVRTPLQAGLRRSVAGSGPEAAE